MCMRNPGRHWLDNCGTGWLQVALEWWLVALAVAGGTLVALESMVGSLVAPLGSKMVLFNPKFAGFGSENGAFRHKN